MSKATMLIRVCEEMALDQLLKQEPELPRRDFHFKNDLILNHAEEFNIITKKTDTFSTMNHCMDSWIYVVAQLNKTTFIENSKVKIKNGEIRIYNEDIDAGFNNEGKLVKLYRGDIKPDQYLARLEDLYIKGCSQQLYNVLKLTFI